jgi:MFS transporter, DHA2 family, lincomycin resistance protein
MTWPPGHLHQRHVQWVPPQCVPHVNLVTARVYQSRCLHLCPCAAAPARKVWSVAPAAAARGPHLVVAVAAFAAFLATFNETCPNVAFTPIMKGLGVDVSTVQWLATGYGLGAAVMVPVAAFLYRCVPTRAPFAVTVSLLVVGSVVGALAPSFWVLSVGRLVQAIGTGMLIPTGMSTTLDVAPRHGPGTSRGVMGAMTTLGPSLGVVVAGGLLSVSGWATLVRVFGAPAALCLVAGPPLVPDVAPLTRPAPDVRSVAMIGLALVGLPYGISSAFSGDAGLAPVSAALGAVALVALLRRQPTLAQPLLDPRPLAVRPFALGVTMNMITLVIVFALNILVPVFVQGALGRSEIDASWPSSPPSSRRRSSRRSPAGPTADAVTAPSCPSGSP